MQTLAQAILGEGACNPLQLINEALTVLRGHPSAAPPNQGVPPCGGLHCILKY